MTTSTQNKKDAKFCLAGIRLVTKFQLLQQKRFLKGYWKWNLQAKLKVKSSVMVLLHEIYNYIAIFHFPWVSAPDFYFDFSYMSKCFCSSPLATKSFLRTTETELSWGKAICLRVQWDFNSGAQWELWKCLFYYWSEWVQKENDDYTKLDPQYVPFALACIQQCIQACSLSRTTQTSKVKHM